MIVYWVKLLVLPQHSLVVHFVVQREQHAWVVLVCIWVGRAVLLEGLVGRVVPVACLIACSVVRKTKLVVAHVVI